MPLNDNYRETLIFRFKTKTLNAAVMLAPRVFHDRTPIQPEEQQENSYKPGNPCLNVGPNLSFILSGKVAANGGCRAGKDKIEPKSILLGG